MRRALPAGLLALPLFLFLAAIYAWPVGSLLASSVTDPSPGWQNYRHLFTVPVYLHVFFNTFSLACVVTIATLLLAYPVAYHLSVVSQRQLRWLMFFILVPSWTSILVRSFAWLVLLGRRGIVNSLLLSLGLLHHPLQFMFNTGTVAFAMVEILLPFMVLPLYATMRNIDLTLMQAARGLGAGRLQAFWHVYLPLSLPGLMAGISTVFVLCLGFFITPTLLGGRRDVTVTMLIMQQFTALLNWGFGAALAAVLLAVTLAVLLLFNVVLRAGRRVA